MISLEAMFKEMSEAYADHREICSILADEFSLWENNIEGVLYTTECEYHDEDYKKHFPFWLSIMVQEWMDEESPLEEEGFFNKEVKEEFDSDFDG